MVTDPKVEEPTRDLLEHAIRGELRELTELMTKLGAERMAACLTLCLRVSGYVVIDIAGHKWPTEADLREIAQRMAAVDLNFNLEETDAYAFLARAAIGFEPLFDVFPDKEGRAVMVPVLTTAALLASYRRSPRHWWEYLDAVEQALEQAAPLPEETVPAVLLLSRCNYAVKTQKAGERTAGV
jgi:hypothetical protein